MQKIAAAILATSLLIPCSSYAADTGRLAPGKAAGVDAAQSSTGTLVFVGGGVAMIAAFSLLITDGKLVVTPITGNPAGGSVVVTSTTSH